MLDRKLLESVSRLQNFIFNSQTIFLYDFVALEVSTRGIPDEQKKKLPGGSYICLFLIWLEF